MTSYVFVHKSPRFYTALHIDRRNSLLVSKYEIFFFRLTDFWTTLYVYGELRKKKFHKVHKRKKDARIAVTS